MSRTFTSNKTLAPNNNPIVHPIKSETFNILLLKLNEPNSFSWKKTLHALTALAAHFSSEQVDTLANTLSVKLNTKGAWQNTSTWEAGIHLLGELAPRITSEMIYDTFQKILAKMSGDICFPSVSRTSIAKVVTQILPRLNDHQVIELYAKLLDMLKSKTLNAANDEPDSRVFEMVGEVFAALIPRLTSAHIQSALNLIEPHIQNDEDWNIRTHARNAYAHILAEDIKLKLSTYRTQEAFVDALQVVQIKLDDHLPIARQAGLQILQAVAKEITDSTQIRIVLEKIKPFLEDSHRKVQYQALQVLSAIIPKLSAREILQLFPQLIEKLNHNEIDIRVAAAKLLKKMSQVTKLPKLTNAHLQMIRNNVIAGLKYEFLDTDVDSLKTFNRIAPLLDSAQMTSLLQPIQKKLCRLDMALKENEVVAFIHAVPFLTTNEVNTIFNLNVVDHLADKNCYFRERAHATVNLLAPRLSAEQSSYYFKQLLGSQKISFAASTEALQLLAMKLPANEVETIFTEWLIKLEDEQNRYDERYMYFILGLLPRLNVQERATTFNLALTKLNQDSWSTNSATKVLTAMIPTLTTTQIGEVITALYSHTRNGSPFDETEDTFMKACLASNKCTALQLQKANVHNDPERIALQCQAAWTESAKQSLNVKKNGFFGPKNLDVNHSMQASNLRHTFS